MVRAPANSSSTRKPSEADRSNGTARCGMGLGQWLIPLPVLVLWAGCASFKPAPASYQPHLERVVSKTNGPVIVSLAVLGRQEAEKIFDLPLHKKGVQPVWIRVQNLGTNVYYFLPASLDADYFPPAEVAYLFRKIGARNRNRRVLHLMEEKRVPQFLPPQSTIEGFVFATLDRGVKYARVDLQGEAEFRSLEFFAYIPGQQFDFQKVDFESIYRLEEIKDYSLKELPAALRALPATTTDAAGHGAGDPLNLVVLGQRGQFGLAFVRQGWDVTEVLTLGNVFKLIGSFLFKRTWKTSPVSPLYLFNRQQDFALQKARATIHGRNHLRLWLAPFTCEGRIVFVGQISRDIGIRFTFKAPGWVTHKIDPEVDEARNYLTHQMLSTGSIDQMGWVDGVGKTTSDEPGQNLTGDPYLTDGLRVLLFLSDQFVSPANVHIHDWRSTR